MKLAWGTKISEYFQGRVLQVAAELDIDPSWLMACMAFESGGTFSPSIMNAAGSGAVGLIQFMPQTALALGTTTDQLRAMADVEQFEFVRKYFLPMKSKLHSVEDVYMTILWPSAVEKSSNYVLFDSSDVAHPKRYVQNAGLDWNKDGKITKDEATVRIRKLLAQGLLEGNVTEVQMPG